MQATDGAAEALLRRNTAHLCIDMQNIFAKETEWQTPWMPRVLPVVAQIAEHHPERTIFTRFIPPEVPEQAHGAWRDYFERWRQFTTHAIHPELLELVEPLQRYVPPAIVIDKPGYTPFRNPALLQTLRDWDVQTLVVTGAETDVCVLAAVFSAMEAGFHVVIAQDAICGSADETHDALMTVYASRFSQQIVLSQTAEIIEHWRR
ncbi:cysteine hydrolase family protein [Mangrovicella endophytica]|uniref:cysteine hydrolase family protein n=1 Tax=Mangrovicella endophytica TaxID=2066697 RepID=UPI000C9DDE14|nr:cysteine hydrolase [Mangrovicella endophytica]